MLCGGPWRSIKS
uniref:Uncharacterized protein n=1 Tax=Arundo donax TaxID=35708 RepID=A0A0A9EM42_ARUDO